MNRAAQALDDDESTVDDESIRTIYSSITNNKKNSKKAKNKNTKNKHRKENSLEV